MLENKPTEENTHNGMKYPSHIKAKLCTCKYCRKSFSHKSHLNDHIKSIHRRSGRTLGETSDQIIESAH